MSNTEKYCSQCGAVNDIDAVFCKNCGQRFEQQQVPMVTQEQSAFEVASDQSPQYQQQGYHQASYESHQYSTNYIEVPNSTIDAATAFVREPSRAAPTLMMDPDAPSGILIVLAHALLLGLVSYLTLTNDTFFDTLFREQYEQQLSTNDELTTDIDTIRSTIATFTAVITIIGVFISWLIGSFFMGLFIKGGLPVQSPMRYDLGRAMRQQTAYRSVVYLPLYLILLITVFINSPYLYTTINNWVGLVASLFSAYLVIKSFDRNIGYSGTGKYIFAFLIVLGKLISF